MNFQNFLILFKLIQQSHYYFLNLKFYFQQLQVFIYKHLQI